MSKIRLSILLLTSFFIFSCTNNHIKTTDLKYSLAYIGGEYDGLLLKNHLMGGLKNSNLYDKNSNFEIKAKISHTSNLFVTNIDNTSNREKISTKLSYQIYDLALDCKALNGELNVSQFYIYASSDKFLSNQAALKKIKKDNTKSTVRKLINILKSNNYNCHE